MIDLVAFITSNALLVSALFVSLLLAIVLEYRKGGKAISVAELTRLVNDNKALVVDIRQEKDYQAGHISQSVNIPMDRIYTQTVLLNKHADRKNVLVCANGLQAKSVVEKLAEKGVLASRLAGGIQEWTASNAILIKG